MVPIVGSPVIWPDRLLSTPSLSMLNRMLPSGVIEPRIVKLPTELPGGAAPRPQ